MFLKMIRLKNVKCFSDITLSFERENDSIQSFKNENDISRSFKDENNDIRKWTLLLAENGMGKSTLLKAIALVTSGSDAIVELLKVSSDWVRYGHQNCEISALLVPKKEEEGEEREDHEIHLTIERGDTPKQVVKRNKKEFAWFDSTENKEEEDRNYFVLGFGASRRFSRVNRSRKKTSGFTNKRAQRVATLFNPDASIKRFNPGTIPVDKLDALSNLLPEIKRIHKRNGQLLFDTPDGTVPLHCLSDGYLAMVTWMGDLLLQVLKNFKDFKSSKRSPFEKRGLLLIDEIDLHLHPKYQRQLLTSLHESLPNFQFVVTTHSPMTAQQAWATELHCLTRGTEDISIFPFRGDPRILLLHQLIMSPLFGLDTDESQKVEDMKNTYRQLRDKSDRTSDENTELENLTEQLTDLPIGGRTNIDFSQLYRELTEIMGDGT